MRLWVLILAFSFAPILSWAQVNLVPNQGFENYSDCPNGPGQIDRLYNWFKIRSADYYHSCGINNFSVPLNPNGHAIPFDSAYVGLVLWNKPLFAREFIGVRLTESLKPDTKYFFKCWVQPCDSMSYAVKNFGALFTIDTLPTQNSNLQMQYLVDQTPQVKYIGDRFIMERDEWTLVSGEFIAEGGEKYMFLGNFDSDAETDTFFIGGSLQYPQSTLLAYVYIDNVSLIEDTTTSVNELELNKLTVNFNDGNLIVNGNVSIPLDIELYDLSGRLVKSFTLQSAQGQTSLPLSDIQSGVYLYNVIGKNTREAGKLMIMK